MTKIAHIATALNYYLSKFPILSLIFGVLYSFYNYISNHLQSRYYEPLPLFLFGMVSLIGGVLSFVLPETLGQKLPDTVRYLKKFVLLSFKIDYIVLADCGSKTNWKKA